MPKMKFLGQGFQKLYRALQTDTQTDETQCITMPHSRVVTEVLTAHVRIQLAISLCASCINETRH